MNNYLKQKNLDININYKNISLCTLSNSNIITPQTQAKQYILLSGKYFIFKHKCSNEIPHFKNYLNYLEKQIQIEKHIALKKDKLQIHNNKWRNIL